MLNGCLSSPQTATSSTLSNINILVMVSYLFSVVRMRPLYLHGRVSFTEVAILAMFSTAAAV